MTDPTDNSVDNKINQLNEKIDQIHNQLNQNQQIIKAPTNNLYIVILNSLLLLSVVIGIILTFSSKEETSPDPIKGVPFSYNQPSIQVIQIFDTIDYQKMMPYVSKQLKLAKRNKNVKGIILKINSPGGTVAGSQEIYRQILQFKKETKIPVVAVLGDVAASGGYYVACAADTIIARSGTITASIGVIMTSFTFQKLFEDLGIKQDVIKSGKFKAIGANIGRDKTPEELAILQKLVDNTYIQFFNAVWENRKGRKNLTKTTLKNYADGRIVDGFTAEQIGLVDQLGGIEDAIELLEKETNNKKLYLLEDERSPLDKLMNFLETNQRVSVENFLKSYNNGTPLYLYVGGK